MRRVYRLTRKNDVELVVTGFICAAPPGLDGEWVLFKNEDSLSRGNEDGFVLEPIGRRMWSSAVTEITDRLRVSETKRHAERLTEIKKLEDLYGPKEELTRPPQEIPLSVSSDVNISQGAG